MTIKAYRTGQQHEGARLEFRHGSFYRYMPLPAGAKEDDIDATYDTGILSVTMPVTETREKEKRIDIKRARSSPGRPPVTVRPILPVVELLAEVAGSRDVCLDRSPNRDSDEPTRRQFTNTEGDKR